MLCVRQHGASGGGAQPDASSSVHNAPCSANRAVPSAQVHQARTESRAEWEAAAEQRLAALDQARREEREDAVREALALGARRVRARPGPRHRYRVGSRLDTGPYPTLCPRFRWAAQQAAVPCPARSCAPSRHAVRCSNDKQSAPGAAVRAAGY